MTLVLALPQGTGRSALAQVPQEARAPSESAMSLFGLISYLSNVLLGRPLKDLRGLCPQAKHLWPWDILLGFHLLHPSIDTQGISSATRAMSHGTGLFCCPLSYFHSHVLCRCVCVPVP